MGTSDESRRELEHLYGKGTTASDLLSFGRAMAKPLSKSERAAVDAELAAEEAADEAWWQTTRRRDKKS